MFKDRLKELRITRGYTMDDLANIYNSRYNGRMNKSTLSRYENGLQEPMYTVANNLAEIFGVTTDYLTRDEDSLTEEQIKKIFAKNLNYYLTLNGEAQGEVAQKIGVSRSTFANWCSGRKVPRVDKADALAEHFGILRSDLLKDKNKDSLPRNAILMNEEYKIPILGRIAAGMPIFAEENIEGYELADVTTPDEYFYLRVQGDSMVGARIFDGALVLVRQQPCAEDGQIVACLVNGEDATLKRYRKQGDTIILMPENSAYAPIILSAQEFEEGHARILGVAVETKMKL